MAPAEKIFYFIFFSCVWDLRCVILESGGFPCCSALAGNWPPLANVMENWEEFYGCLSPLSALFFFCLL